MKEKKNKTPRLKKAYEIGTVVNFAATVILCIAAMIYCMAVKLPLSALTEFPVALLMIAFSFISWQTGGALWLLAQIVSGAIVWYYLPMKWLFLADLVIGMAVLIMGIVLLAKKSKEEKKRHFKSQLSKRKQIIAVCIPTLVISISFFISAFTVSADTFYVGNAVKKYKTPCQQEGTVIKHEYSSFIYDENGAKTAENAKYCYVYLPYGYDDTQKYDVMYVMHGGGASAESWIGEGQGNTTKNMLDTMIAEKTIKPAIIVFPSIYYGNDSKNGGSTSNFKYELKNDLMPSVEGKYSTYAGKVTTPQAFTDSRNHRAFGGYSMGSATTYQSALIGALDYFSYFAPMHGGFIDHEEVIKAVTEGEYKDYKINYLLCCEGTLDSTYPGHLDLYRKLIDCGEIREGRNGDIMTLLYREHNMNAWQTDLYNALVRFF